MKNTFTILLSGLLLCGCSQKQATSKVSATEFIQAEQDVTFNHGSCVLHVAKRDGNSLAGIRYVLRPGKSSEQVMTADTGTIFPSATNRNWVLITLHKPKDQATGHVYGDITAALEQ